MALAFTLLAGVADSTDTNVYTVPSSSPTAGCGLLLVVVGHNGGADPGLPAITSGFTVADTWANEADITGATHRVTLFSNYFTSGTGTVTLTYGGARTGCLASLIQVTGQDGTDFVIQPGTLTDQGGTPTSKAVTLAGALDDAGNAVFGAVGLNVNNTFSFSDGSELDDRAHTSPSRCMGVGYEIGDTTFTVTWATAASTDIGVAAEIVAAAGAAAQKPKTLLTLGVG